MSGQGFKISRENGFFFLFSFLRKVEGVDLGAFLVFV
jgi:hypothetical protein